MPTVLRVGSLRFHFYSNGGDEPAHIHVDAGDGECKFWLQPIALAFNRGMSAAEVRTAERIIFEHQELLRARYHEFHGR